MALTDNEGLSPQILYRVYLRRTKTFFQGCIGWVVREVGLPRVYLLLFSLNFSRSQSTSFQFFSFSFFSFLMVLCHIFILFLLRNSFYNSLDYFYLRCKVVFKKIIQFVKLCLTIGGSFENLKNSCFFGEVDIRYHI